MACSGIYELSNADLAMVAGGCSTCEIELNPPRPAFAASPQDYLDSGDWFADYPESWSI